MKKKDVEGKYPIGLPHNFDRKLSFAKTKKEVKKVSRKIGLLGFTKINYVGQSFKRKYKGIINNSEKNAHWRRGHWRNQKTGNNLQEIKLIWIMPTIVNIKKGKPEKGHLYNVE